MADKKYTFPEGTMRIPIKDLAEVFYNYETVEIPGSVSEVILRDTRFYDRDKIILKNLILHEGTLSINATLNGAKYNIPSTLINISCDGIPPKIICLKDGFQKADWSDFSDVEYLQAYTTADLRYSKYSKLKHYVYLGEKMKNWLYSPFEKTPSGCVIHVENEKMAKSVLKKCDVFKHYVVVDAAEWKDFPADKLALTTEEYDPESRILPLQIKMREEKRQEEEKKNIEKQKELRQKEKNRVIEKMTSQIIYPILESSVGPRLIKDKMGWMAENYRVSATTEEETGNALISIKVVVARDLWNRSWNPSLAINVELDADDVTSQMNSLSMHISKIRDFIEENRANFEYYSLHIGDGQHTATVSIPGISFPFLDSAIVGSFKMSTINKDIKKIKEITEGLEKLIKQAREDFPKGFDITPSK